MEPKPIKLPSKSYNLPYLLILTWNKPLTLNESIEKFRKYIKKEKLYYKEISKSFSYLNKYELIVQKDDFDRRNKKNSANRVFILNEISNILRLENDEKNKLNEILVNYELTETEYKRLSKLYIEKQKNYDFVYELTILMVVYLLIIIKFNIDLVHSEDYDYSLKKKLILKKYKMPLIDFSLITELKH